jgi:hypothetical protein
MLRLFGRLGDCRDTRRQRKGRNLRQPSTLVCRIAPCRRWGPLAFRSLLDHILGAGPANTIPKCVFVWIYDRRLW